MKQTSDASEAFFGVAAGTDPFLLLGLPRSRADESAVLSALGQRMAQIAGHARSQTPEANELRLALHAAAAQLLDPQLQELLLESSDADDGPGPVETAPSDHTEPGALSAHASQVSAPPPKAAATSNLTHDLLRVVASHGGWNQHALRQVVMLAHARGIPSSELPVVVTRVLSAPLIGGMQATAPTQAGASQPASVMMGSTRTGHLSSAGASGKRKASNTGSWIVTALFTVLTVGSLLLVWSRLTAESTPSRVSPDASTSAPAQMPENSASDGASPVTAPTAGAMSLAESVDALQDIASENIITEDMQAVAIEAARSVARDWLSLESDEISAVHNALVDLLYANTNDSTFALRLIETIASSGSRSPATSEELSGSAWAVGTLSRLSAERNLSTTVDASIVGRLSNLLADRSARSSTSFAKGLTTALSGYDRELARQSVNVSVWRTWLSILGTVHAKGSTEHDMAVIAAIEEVAVEGDEPSQSRPSFEALELLASQLELEEKNAASKALVGWLSDDRVSVADLSVIMRTLVTNSSVSGLSENVIISAGADPSRRMSVRAELEELLLGIDATATEAIESWSRIADQELSRTLGTSSVDILARAAARSRLSGSARDTFWGRYEDSKRTLSNLTDDLDRLTNRLGDDPQAYLGGDGSIDWGERYLGARQNIPVRQALLSELTRGRHRLGPVAAEALVRDAVFGTPAAVRAQAQEVMRLYATSPAVANAMLELLPRMPKVESTVQLIEAVTSVYLPSPSDPDWEHLARQALVETLLLRTSGVGEGEVIDQLVELLTESYRDRLSLGIAQYAGNAPEDLIELTSELSLRWARSASSGPNALEIEAALEAIQMKRIGRLTLAEGLIDRFAAEQISLVETMGVAIRSERPGASARIDQIMRELSERRRSSGDVIQQISYVEEAAVRLWKIRLGADE